LDRREALDLLGSYLMLSFAFAVYFARDSWLSAPFAPEAWSALVEPFKLSLVTLGPSFVVHELAHRAVAMRWGASARYVAWWSGLALTVIMALFLGIVFAMPGAVVTSYLPPERMGRAALAGPLSNLCLIPAFASLSTLGGAWEVVSHYGTVINAFFAFFNSLPIRVGGRPLLDGAHIREWNPLVQTGFTLISLLVLVAVM